jgi:hypothetical protein
MPYVSIGASGVKDFVLSIVHVIVTLIFLVLLNMGIAWVLNNVVFHLFEWFNHISLFWKLIILFPEGYIVVEVVMRLTSFVTAFLGMLIYAKLPINKFTTKTTVIINNFKG